MVEFFDLNGDLKKTFSLNENSSSGDGGIKLGGRPSPDHLKGTIEAVWDDFKVI